MIPFFSTTFYAGPAAQALGGADLSFVVGLVVSGVLYLIFSHGINREAETEACRKSDLELEGTVE